MLEQWVINFPSDVNLVIDGTSSHEWIENIQVERTRKATKTYPFTLNTREFSGWYTYNFNNNNRLTRTLEKATDFYSVVDLHKFSGEKTIVIKNKGEGIFIGVSTGRFDDYDRHPGDNPEAWGVVLGTGSKLHYGSSDYIWGQEVIFKKNWSARLQLDKTTGELWVTGKDNKGQEYSRTSIFKEGNFKKEPLFFIVCLSYEGQSIKFVSEF